MADKLVSVSSTVLADAVVALQALVQLSSDAQLNSTANRAAMILSQALRSSNGPGSFSGNEVGQYHLDPNQSPYA